MLEDFGAERATIVHVLTDLGAPPPPPVTIAEAAQGAPAPPPEEELPEGPPQLQLSWSAGHIVAWAAYHGTDPELQDAVRARLTATGATADAWHEHRGVALPDGGQAPAVAAAVSATLGWLVALGTAPESDAVSPGAVWLGRVAGLAVRLVAQGRMVPQLDSARRRAGNGRRSPFAVRWAPALHRRGRARGAGAAPCPARSRRWSRARTRGRSSQAVVADLLDVICRDAAARIDVPAPPPRPAAGPDVAETVLARLDGTVFDALRTSAAPRSRRALQRWAHAVTGTPTVRLVVQLDPPDEGDAWHLRTLVAGGSQQAAAACDAAMANALGRPARRASSASSTGSSASTRRCGAAAGARRGEVVLSQDEAWELMTRTGPVAAWPRASTCACRRCRAASPSRCCA